MTIDIPYTRTQGKTIPVMNIQAAQYRTSQLALFDTIISQSRSIDNAKKFARVP